MGIINEAFKKNSEQGFSAQNSADPAFSTVARKPASKVIPVLFIVTLVGIVVAFLLQLRTLNHISLLPQSGVGQEAKGTEELVAQKEALEAELAQVKNLLYQAERSMQELAKENRFLTGQSKSFHQKIARLRDKVRMWEGKIKNLAEGSQVAQMRRKSARELALRIQVFRKNAQQEIDRLKSLAGNHGYLVKSGQSTFVSTEKAIDLSGIVVSGE